MGTEEKRDYQFRKADLIPVIGLVKYVKRCFDELDKFPMLKLSEDYDAEYMGRTMLLGLYNSAIIGTAVGGLVSLLK